jgi:hypothetical protein
MCAQGLKEATAQVRALNRNMEHIVEVGKSFERPAMLWTEFCKDIKQASHS